MKNRSQEMLNFIELFAGSGGLGMGIAKAGFSQVIAIEKDKNCCNTLEFNRNQGLFYLAGWDIINSDVRDVVLSQYQGKVSLVSGGPPCQPFSLGGRHLASEDQRDLFPEAIRAVREIRPQAFIFENVRGLTRKSFAEYFEYIKLQLTYPLTVRLPNESSRKHFERLEEQFTSGDCDQLKYNITAKVLNAADFGLPQKRERLFIVGFNNKLPVRWHFPKPTHSFDSLIWSQRYGDYWDRNEVPKKYRLVSKKAESRLYRLSEKPNNAAWKTIRESIMSLPDPLASEGYESLNVLNHEYRPGARIYPGHCGSFIDEPAKTLKAGVHGVPGGENMIKFPDGSVRYFTLRESARLQSYPDEYFFDCSWSKAMYQLGNAVPIKLSYIIAKSVKSALSEALSHNKPKKRGTTKPASNSALQDATVHS
ncbi:MAG: DNA (cytosine-5-)-methyltransferase [Cyclobacteriaceae bacterium]